MPVKVALVALLIAITGCSLGAPGDPPAGPADDQEAAPPASEEVDDSGAVIARTAMELEGDCSPRPRREDGRLVLAADLEAVNTGNVGVRARIRVSWPRMPFARVTTSRTVSVEQGQTVPVEVRLPVSRGEARDVTRAADRGRQCHVRHRITGAFGAPSR